MESLIKQVRQPLDWYMIGSWNPVAGQSKTFETVSSRDFTKSEILIFAPFANNRFHSSVFSPKYSVATYNQKLIASWTYEGSSYSVEIEKVDNTHFKLTGSSNLPSDCQILCFCLAYYGSY